MSCVNASPPDSKSQAVDRFTRSDGVFPRRSQLPPWERHEATQGGIHALLDALGREPTSLREPLFLNDFGGGRGIRTPEGLAALAVFKCAV